MTGSDVNENIGITERVTVRFLCLLLYLLCASSLFFFLPQCGLVVDILWKEEQRKAMKELREFKPEKERG